MEAISNDEFAAVSRVVEITSDAVALCEASGTILHVNGVFVSMVSAPRETIVGQDIRDFLFSSLFERTQGQGLPFALDGAPSALMLKLADGSFIPVQVRALAGRRPAADGDAERPRRAVVVLKSLQEQYANDRKQRRLLAELRTANKRLSGTLGIIMATVGSNDLAALLDTVLNQMAETLEATAATIYLTESGGFKLHGVSEGAKGSYVPDFVPFGAGVPTYVLRAGRPCRLMIVPATEPDGSGEFYDLDERASHRLRQKDTPPFRTLIAVPVYFGTQMLGVVELGWSRPCTPHEYDVRVLEVICDYLSIEIVGMAGSLRSARTADLERSLNRVRDIVFAHRDDPAGQWGELSGELRRMLNCQVCPVLHDRIRGCYVVDFEGEGRVELPVSVDEAFFSTTAPAARTRRSARVDFASGPQAETGSGGIEPEQGRLARVDRSMRIGRWLAGQGLPSQGVFIDLGPDAAYWGAGLEVSEEPGKASESTALVPREVARPSRMLLLLRDAAQEPFDDLEFDYLSHMVRDLEVLAAGARERQAEQNISQTLQAGMRSTLGRVPGITTDSLYSSATSQALVGGDFYTLVRMPDERAVMILGDVSGKGIEAASMSALVKTALSAYAWEGAGPAEMAASLNRMLMSFSRPETFVTAFIAKIDLQSGRVAYCSAGHPPTMLLHPQAEGGEVEQVGVQSGVIGAFEDMSYEEGLLVLSPGDILFMYTDGAIEARSPSGGFFGEDRLRDVLLRASSTGLEGLCAKVLAELDAFTCSALDDDIALVALRFDEEAFHGR